nr:1082_t:CDS:2 [Entrophospora candida]
MLHVFWQNNLGCGKNYSRNEHDPLKQVKQVNLGIIPPIMRHFSNTKILSPVLYPGENEFLDGNNGNDGGVDGGGVDDNGDNGDEIMLMAAVTLMMILITMMDDFDANEVIPK